MKSIQPDGYLALPPSDQGHGILVLHAWWGLNDTMKSICDRLAESGFVSFAPDLYHGQLADSISDAETLSSDLFANVERTRADVFAAAEYLKDQTKADSGSLAVIGFSLGAYFALDLSVMNPGSVRSVIVFYGTRPGDYKGSRASYLGHFAESDKFEPQAEVEALEKNLRLAGRPVSFYRYPGTGHWFFEPDRQQAFSKEAADLAWERTLAFLRRSSRI